MITFLKIKTCFTQSTTCRVIVQTSTFKLMVHMSICCEIFTDFYQVNIKMYIVCNIQDQHLLNWSNFIFKLFKCEFQILLRKGNPPPPPILLLSFSLWTISPLLIPLYHTLWTITIWTKTHMQTFFYSANFWKDFSFYDFIYQALQGLSHE